MQINNFTSNKNQLTYNYNLRFSVSSIINIFFLYFLFKSIVSKNSDKKVKSLPDDLDNAFRNLVDMKSKDCVNEIALIVKKDYKESFLNPYKVLANQEKYLNKTLTQISKKLTKYNFLEQKNFTGIRWINPKSFSGEIKRLVELNFIHIIEYFEKNYYNCKNTVTEFILENFQYFFSKINEIKKIFQKFYLFKGIKKFVDCMAITNNSFQSIHFRESLQNGKITIKKMLSNLKNIISAILDIIKASNMEIFSKSLKKIILSVKSFPIK